MPCHAGSIVHGLQSETRLPFWCATKNETVAISKFELGAYGVHFLSRDAVSRKFVSVEDAFHTGKFCRTRQLATEARQLMPKKAFVQLGVQF